MDEDDLTAVKVEIYLNRKWLLISVIFPSFAYWQAICSRQVKSRSSGLNEVHEIRYCYPVGASDTKLEKSHLIKV